VPTKPKSSVKPKSSDIQPLAFTIEQALKAVPIGRTKLHELMVTGAVRSVKIGRRRLIPVEALAELLLRESA